MYHYTLAHLLRMVHNIPFQHNLQWLICIFAECALHETCSKKQLSQILKRLNLRASHCAIYNYSYYLGGFTCGTDY